MTADKMDGASPVTTKWAQGMMQPRRLLSNEVDRGSQATAHLDQVARREAGFLGPFVSRSERAKALISTICAANGAHPGGYSFAHSYQPHYGSLQR